MPGATLDHVVIDARDRIDAAAQTFQALGFQLTPRGHHTLGSSNNLAIFGTNYLELLGFGDNAAARPELAPFPIGLNGLVFKTDDAADTARRAQQAGIPAGPANAFSRPVELDGRRQDARFRTTHLPPDTSGIGRVYFCEHQTPDLVWRREWQVHPNGAQQIVRVLVATHEPSRQARLFVQLFGAASVTERPDGTASLALSGGGTILLAQAASTLAPLGEAAPDPAGRGDFLVGLVIRVVSATATAQVLRGVPGLVVGPHRVIVPARAALNTTLLFEDEHAD
jgi:Glyoxalase-like domain